MSLRISLTERLAVEANGTRLDEQRFPGRQSRVAFAYLAVQNGRAVPRDELAEVLWGDELPATWEKALRVLMTKLRALLEECGVDRSTGLTSAFGCYTLTLPEDTWIDVEAATAAIGRAEAALASGEVLEAGAQAAKVAELARRSFLPGEDGRWVEERRRDLRDLLVRALECLRDASFAAGKFGDALRYAEEITELEPFRESSYRALMQAHAAGGNPAEALRVYERCRAFLAEELGVYPSPETEAVYLEILRNPSNGSGDVDPPDEEASHDDSPHPAGDAPPPRRRRRLGAVVAGALLVAAGATAAAFALEPRNKAAVRLLPNSLVRLDPETLRPAEVIPLAKKADGVLDWGGYLWVTHGVLRYGSGGHPNRYGGLDSGRLFLERIDPSTGKKKPVSGGLAPCGWAPDPSGDLWVASCYANGTGDVVRVDAKTTDFVSPHYSLPHSKGFLRGVTYGNRALWVGPAFAGDQSKNRELTRIDLRTGKERPITLDRPPGGLAWFKRRNDLWITDGAEWHSATRLPLRSREQRHTENVADFPAGVVVQGDEVWIGDWNHAAVSHFSAVKRDIPRQVALSVSAYPAGVTSIAAGLGYIWAAVPDDHAVFRIDPKTGHAKRIRLRCYPWGVTVGEHGIWVTLRAKDGPPDPEPKCRPTN